MSPSPAGSRSSGFCSVFSGAFIAENVGVGDKGSGDTKTVDVQTFLEAFLNMSLKSAYFIDEVFFLVKSKTSSLGTTFLKCQIIRISELPDVRLKEFVVHTLYVCVCAYMHTHTHTHCAFY
jgi:hypothetical protein